MKSVERLKLKNYLILLDSVPTPLLVLDSQHKVVARNKEFTSHFNKNGVINQPANLVFSILREDVIVDGVRLTFRVDDYYYYFVIKSIEVEDFQGFLVYIVDRTEIHSLLNEKEQKIKKLEDLIKVIFHDLRTPVSAIIGIADLISSNKQNDAEELKGMLSQANKSCWSFLTQLDDLGAWFSCIQSDNQFSTKIDLNAMIIELFDIYKTIAENKKISLVFNQENTSLVSNKAMLKSILGNLIYNAIKFSHQGSFIHVSYETENNNNIVFSVKDNGIGLSEKDAKKIFDLGFSKQGTSLEKGTGFGLFMVQDFVQKLGGEIWVISREGEGTTFKFRLPI